MTWRTSLLTAVVVMGLAMLPAIASASDSWDSIRQEVYADRTIHDASDVVAIKAPIRPEDQSAVPIKVSAGLADGRTIKSVTFIVDENPSPVAAVFEMGKDRSHVSLTANYRLNQATYVRAVVEASDGALYMTKQYVKFAGGQAACSAPPNGSPEEILANMGKMKFNHESTQTAATSIQPKASLEISHPNHTGMVLDQITLLYIPLRIISNLEVRQGDEQVFTMRGSITMSQDPLIEFDYRVNGADKMHVTVRDTDGASWQKSFPIGQGS